MTTYQELINLQSQYQIELLKSQNGDWPLIKKEEDNLRKTIDWLAKSDFKENQLRLLELVVAYASFALSENQFEYINQLLTACIFTAKQNNYLLAEISLVAYQTKWALGDWDAAIDQIHFAVQVSDPGIPLHARAMQLLGSTLINRGDYDNAMVALLKSRELFRQLEDKKGEISAMMEEAAFYLDKDQYKEALARYLEIASLERECEGSVSVSTKLMLAVVYRKMKDFTQSENLLVEILSLPSELLTSNERATTLHHLGWVLVEKKQYPQALQVANEAFEIYQSIQNYRGTSDAFEQLGEIAFFEGDNINGERYYRLCAETRLRMHNLPGYASITRRLSKLYFANKHPFLANKYLFISAFTYLRVGNLNLARIKRFFIDPLLAINKKLPVGNRQSLA